MKILMAQTPYFVETTNVSMNSIYLMKSANYDFILGAQL